MWGRLATVDGWESKHDGVIGLVTLVPRTGVFVVDVDGDDNRLWVRCLECLLVLDELSLTWRELFGRLKRCQEGALRCVLGVDRDGETFGDVFGTLVADPCGDTQLTVATIDEGLDALLVCEDVRCLEVFRRELDILTEVIEPFDLPVLQRDLGDLTKGVACWTEAITCTDVGDVVLVLVPDIACADPVVERVGEYTERRLIWDGDLGYLLTILVVYLGY